ncbi:MAG: hypothetical protein VX589_20410, partial [Myxococcota bacterium]|nr:hypothetical protein [Myxococcota bacterium]
ILRKDQQGEIDLCVNADGRPVGAPRCGGQHAVVYAMRIIQRGDFTVVNPDGRETKRTLDLPFTTESRQEVLAQHQPIVQPGPDGCVYIRHLRRYFRRVPPKLTPKNQQPSDKNTVPMRANAP